MRGGMGTCMCTRGGLGKFMWILGGGGKSIVTPAIVGKGINDTIVSSDVPKIIFFIFATSSQLKFICILRSLAPLSMPAPNFPAAVIVTLCSHV